MTDSNQNMQASDEITLKELILLIQEYWGVLWGKKWYIITAGLIGGLIFGIIEYRKPVTYTAELTFMVNEDEGGGLGALGGLAASFGLGSGGSSEYNLEKMIALLKSRKIIEQVIFEEIEIDGQTDLVANHIITCEELHKDWIKSEDLSGFLFDFESRFDYSTINAKAIKKIQKVILGSRNKVGMLSSKINDETGIIYLNISSRKEELSIKFLDLLFEKLSKFYVDKTIEKQRMTYEITKQKSDSLRIQVDLIQDELLRLKDSRKNITLQQNNSKELKLERDYQIGLVAYGEALKNYEIADFALKVKTPFIQIIDNPISPLDPSFTVAKFIKQIIIGGIIGCGLISIFLILFNLFFKIIE